MAGVPMNRQERTRQTTKTHRLLLLATLAVLALILAPWKSLSGQEQERVHTSSLVGSTSTRTAAVPPKQIATSTLAMAYEPPQEHQSDAMPISENAIQPIQGNPTSSPTPYVPSTFP